MTCCLLGDNLLRMKNKKLIGRSLVQGPVFLDREKVLILLIKQRIKQVDLAWKWGVTRSAVSRIIAGHAPYSPLLHKLAAALGVSLRSITNHQRP